MRNLTWGFLAIWGSCTTLGLHSLRSGDVSVAVRYDVNERCIKKHGRWKSDVSKDGYIADTFQKRLSQSEGRGL